jgi:polycystin 1L2
MAQDEGGNELRKLDRLLDDERDSNEFLGHTMFWRSYEHINVKQVYRASSIEYKSLKLMFYEMLFFIAFLVMFTCFVIEVKSNTVFECAEQQRHYWSGCTPGYGCDLQSVNNGVQLLNWMKAELTPRAFTDKQFYPSLSNATSIFGLSESTIPWEPRYVGDTMTFILLGNIRVRTQRVVPERGCTTPDKLKSIHGSCLPAFSPSAQSKMTYAKRWTPPYTEHAYDWHPDNMTLAQPVDGYAAEYSGDGFFFDLPLNRTLAESTFTDLEEWGWLDDQTRSVIIELNTFNPNVNVIVHTRMAFEFSLAGGIMQKHEVYAFRAFQLSLSLMEGDELRIFMFEVISVAMFVMYIAYTCFVLYKSGMSFFWYIWNIVDVVAIGIIVVLFVYHIIVYTLVGYEPSLQPEVLGDPEIFIPISRMIPALKSINECLALLSLFMWVKVCKYATLLANFQVLVRVVERCLHQLIIFASLLLTLFVGFAVAFYMGFGNKVPLFNTMIGSFFSMFFLLVGGVDLGPILENADALGAALFYSFLIIAWFLLFNIFMAIVLDIYTLAQLLRRSPEFENYENPMQVFIWTFSNKLQGNALVGKESEDDIGRPDEQHVSLALLPEDLQEEYHKANEEKLALLDESITWLKSTGRSQKEVLALEDVQRKSRPAVALGQEASSVDETVVSRVQIQRMMNENEKLQEVLGTKRAIDVIRQFRIEKEPDPYDVVTRLQKNVIKKLHELEDANLKLTFGEIESLKMVSQGLHDALTEVQTQWREELTAVLTMSSHLSKALVDLTKTMGNVQVNHKKIEKAQEIAHGN